MKIFYLPFERQMKLVGSKMVHRYCQPCPERVSHHMDKVERMLTILLDVRVGEHASLFKFITES